MAHGEGGGSGRESEGGVGGRISMVLTQKQLTLCIRLEPALVAGLWAQGTATAIATGHLAASFGGGRSSHPLPAGWLPRLDDAWQPRAGATVEVWLSRHADSAAKQTVLSAGPGLALEVAVGGPGRGVVLRLRDGKASTVAALATDKVCAAALAAEAAGQHGMEPHHVVAIVDAGPGIMLLVVDGVLCDGGPGWRGWEWLPPTLGDIAGRGAAVLEVGRGYGGEIGGGRLYGRALTVSEAISNYQVSPQAQPASTTRKHNPQAQPTSTTRAQSRPTCAMKAQAPSCPIMRRPGRQCQHRARRLELRWTLSSYIQAGPNKMDRRRGGCGVQGVACMS